MIFRDKSHTLSLYFEFYIRSDINDRSLSRRKVTEPWIYFYFKVFTSISRLRVHLRRQQWQKLISLKCITKSIQRSIFKELSGMWMADDHHTIQTCLVLQMNPFNSLGSWRICKRNISKSERKICIFVNICFHQRIWEMFFSYIAFYLDVAACKLEVSTINQ